MLLKKKSSNRFFHNNLKKVKKHLQQRASNLPRKHLLDNPLLKVIQPSNLLKRSRVAALQKKIHLQNQKVNAAANLRTRSRKLMKSQKRMRFKTLMLKNLKKSSKMKYSSSMSISILNNFNEVKELSGISRRNSNLCKKIKTTRKNKRP